MSKHISLPLLLLAAIVLLVTPAAAFSGSGAGTSVDPYQITTPAQFLELRDDTRGYFVLMNDLDMTDHPWSGTQTLNSIQVPGYAANFTLDGQDHIVKNLVITREVAVPTGNLEDVRYYRAMFPHIIRNNYVVFKNIVFESPSVSRTLIPTSASQVAAKVAILGYDATESGTKKITLSRLGFIDADVYCEVHQYGTYMGEYLPSAYVVMSGYSDWIDVFVTGTLNVKAVRNSGSVSINTYGVTGPSAYAWGNLYVSLSGSITAPGNTGSSTYAYPAGFSKTYGKLVYDYDKYPYTIPVANVTAATTDQLKTKETFTGVGFDFVNVWAMSKPDSILGGMPVFKSILSLAYVGSNLSLNTPTTMGAYTSATLEWEDLEPNSMATDYTFTIKDPDDDTVYSASTENGSYVFTPEEEGTWTVTYTCSDDTRTETITVTPSPSDLNITIPDHSLYLGESVVVSWADDNPHSSATDYLLSIAAPNTTVIYSSATDAGSYTITPDVTGTWNVTYSCSDDTVQEFVGVSYESIVGTVDMTPTVIGGSTPISWSFNAIDYRPDTGKPVDGYRLKLYEGDEASAMIGIGRLIATIPITEETGNVSQMLTTVAGFSDTRPYFSGVLEVVDIDGGTLMIASDSYQGFFQIPSLVSAEPDEGFLAPEDLDDNAILITLNRGSLPAMLTTSSRLNITYATYIDTEWVYTSVYDELPDNEEYTLDTSVFSSTLYQRPLTFVIESNYDNTVSEHGEYAWVLMPMPVEPKVLWKAPSSGNPITTAVERAPVAVYVEAGSLTAGQMAYESYAVYLYRYNPMSKGYDQYDVLENGYLPLMVAPMSELAAPFSFSEITFDETGTYRAAVFLIDADEVEDPFLICSGDIIITQNWLSPDTQADTAGSIFGIDGEAVKLVAGMLIVLLCAAVPPLVFGNSHPMVIMIGGVVGLVIGYALSLIPFWILLLIAIAAIAMVILNVRGGQTGGGDGGYQQMPPPGGA